MISTERKCFFPSLKQKKKEIERRSYSKVPKNDQTIDLVNLGFSLLFSYFQILHPKEPRFFQKKQRKEKKR